MKKLFNILLFAILSISTLNCVSAINIDYASYSASLVYTFNNTLQSAIGGSPLSDTGTVSLVNSPYNGLMDFGTSAGDFSTTKMLSGSLSTSYTALYVSCWINSSASTGNARWIFGQDQSTAWSRVSAFVDSGNVVQWNIEDGGTNRTITYPFPNNNSWNHWIFTAQNGGLISIYLNGINVVNTTFTQFGSNRVSNFAFGNAYWAGSVGGQNIWLDECVIGYQYLGQEQALGLYRNYSGLYFNISSVNCTSSGDSIAPYETDDTTPTFTFSTNMFSKCRISDENINYTSMGSSRDCDYGQSLNSHTCTLTAQDALTNYNTTVYVSCDYVEYTNSSYAFPMLISSLDTPNSSEAIQQGIENSVIGTGVTIYTNQKVYLRALNGSSVTATVAKVAVYGNQRWLFNYVNESSSTLGLFNLSPIVYSLDMKNMSLKAIRGNVTSFINSTKI